MELQGAEGNNRVRRLGSKHLDSLGKHRMRLGIRKTLQEAGTISNGCLEGLGITHLGGLLGLASQSQPDLV